MNYTCIKSDFMGSKFWSKVSEHKEHKSTCDLRSWWNWNWLQRQKNVCM